RPAHLLAQEHLQTRAQNEIAAAKPLVSHDARGENGDPRPAPPRDRIGVDPREAHQRAPALTPETDFRQGEELLLVMRARRVDVALGQRPDLIELRRRERTARAD